jgi:N-methylhydantoinase A
MSALAIDIGGTFTDIVLYDDATGRFAAHKELTTPSDPARGVVAGIQHLFAAEKVEAVSVDRVVHATTLFTNALIERRGAVTGLLTTQGFRDTLEIGHERKYELYDLHLPMPQPLVRRAPPPMPWWPRAWNRSPSASCTPTRTPRMSVRRHG